MEKLYRHPSPGYTLPFWLDGQPYIAEDGKKCAHFRDTGAAQGIDRCGLFRTKDENAAKAVEQSKAFLKGDITYLPSIEEIKKESLRKEREKFREDKIKMAQSGLFSFENLSKFKEKELHEFAKNMDVPVVTEGGKRKKAEILSEIKEILYPKSEDEQEDQEDEEAEIMEENEK